MLILFVAKLLDKDIIFVLLSTCRTGTKQYYFFKALYIDNSITIRQAKAVMVITGSIDVNGTYHP